MLISFLKGFLRSDSSKIYCSIKKIPKVSPIQTKMSSLIESQRALTISSAYIVTESILNILLQATITSNHNISWICICLFQFRNKITISLIAIFYAVIICILSIF